MNDYLMNVIYHIIEIIGFEQYKFLLKQFKSDGSETSVLYISDVKAYDLYYLNSLDEKNKLAMSRDGLIGYIDMSKFCNLISFNNCSLVRLILLYDLLNDPKIPFELDESSDIIVKALELNDKLESIEVKAANDELGNLMLWNKIYDNFIREYDVQFNADMRNGESFSQAYGRMEADELTSINLMYPEYIEFTEKMMDVLAKITIFGCERRVKTLKLGNNI